MLSPQAMPFYRFIPDTADLDGLARPLPTVIPVNYHDEQVSWAYLQENGYFFLLEGDFRFMMERHHLDVHLATNGADEDDKASITALELISHGIDE